MQFSANQITFKSGTWKTRSWSWPWLSHIKLQLPYTLKWSDLIEIFATLESSFLSTWKLGLVRRKKYLLSSWRWLQEKLMDICIGKNYREYMRQRTRISDSLKTQFEHCLETSLGNKAILGCVVKASKEHWKVNNSYPGKEHGGLIHTFEGLICLEKTGTQGFPGCKVTDERSWWIKFLSILKHVEELLLKHEEEIKGTDQKINANNVWSW